jgi:tetratricopeptide (TPR) repeat protein
MIFGRWTHHLTFVTVLTSIQIVSCSGHKEAKKSQEPVEPPSAAKSDSKEDSGATSLTAERRFLVNSISNNGLTSKSIDRSRAADFAGQHGGGRSKDINAVAAAIAAHRLAGHSFNEAMGDAKVIADLEMAKNVERDIPELVQLELGLIGVQTGRLAFAEFWLDKLIKSKNATIRASAMNAKGVMAVRMDRIPEAMVMFKEALGASNDYKPALMNIGFLALQGGDAATAKKALGSMQDDWYVQSALVTVFRLDGEVDKADGVCDQILAKRPKHKPTLINCGINAWQGKKDYKKARDYINKALAVVGGLAIWDEKSSKLLGAIDAEEARMNHLKAQKEAEDRKAKADEEKTKANPAQPDPGKGAASQPSADGK